MKSLAYLFLGIFFFGILGCVGDTSSTQTGTEGNATDTTGVSTTDTTTTSTGTPTAPECTIPGSMKEGNRFWAKEDNKIIAIVADAETLDKELGESHRILEVYDGANCQRVLRQVLPVDLSPDFPYYLSDITYNNISKVIAIRGFDKFYVLDIANLKTAGPLKPAFLNKRFVDDASSGSIVRMEVWESYLVGYAASMGPFVFDLSNPAKPVAVLPFAEYEVDKGVKYNSLFMLKSTDADDGHQLFMPVWDDAKKELTINPLFQKPRKMETNFNKKFRNNKHLVLKAFDGGPNGTPVAIDMVKMKLVDLPADIATKKDTEIIEWMKNK